MLKKILAIVLAISLLCVALPATVSAEAPQPNTLIRQIGRCYRNTLAGTGNASMDQLCGTFVGYQLYLLKVTASPEIYNGNQFYGVYSQKEVSSGGHRITAYSAHKYTMEQALNAITHNGSKDAYNVMLCFDWTKSGGNYGHVMLIHGIIDGVVYAVDNFTTVIAGPEGNPIIAPIAQFAAIYDGWSSFEGAIDFGVKEYASLCPSYATDMYLRVTEPAILLSQPAPIGSNDSQPVHVAMEGERLLATDVVVGQDLVNYYRVLEGGKSYYIPGAVTQPIRLNTEGLQADIHLQKPLQVGQSGKLSGEIFSTGGLVGQVELVVTNAQGEQVLYSEHYDPRFNHNVQTLQADFSALEQGIYTVKLFASLWNHYDGDGIVQLGNQRICVFQETLPVGEVAVIEPRMTIAFAPVVKHGWLLEDGIWHCYRGGVPRTGWYCYDGIDYYLQEDGAVTTGWANINGEDRFFSDTGAMRTGWLIEENGDVRYMTFNGVSAKGWRNIDGIDYFFDDNGILDETTIPEE